VVQVLGTTLKSVQRIYMTLQICELYPGIAYHVRDWVELNVHNRISEEHESNEHSLERVSECWVWMSGMWTNIHSDGDYHKLRVEAYKRSVFSKAVLLNEPFLDRGEEVPVQPCINGEDENL